MWDWFSSLFDTGNQEMPGMDLGVDPISGTIPTGTAESPGGGSNWTFGTPETEFSPDVISAMMSQSDFNPTGTDTAGGTGTAANLPQITPMTAFQNAPQGTPSPVTEGMNNGNIIKNAGSSIIDTITKNPKTSLGVGGILANLAGNIMNTNATKQGQSDYLKAISWTPEKTENYMNALRNNVTSLYGNQAKGKNEAMSKSNAIRGTGGGSYGKKSEDIGREMRSNIASAMNQGALTTNQPVNANPSAFTTTSPVGQTLTGIGSMAGSTLGTLKDLYLLQQLRLAK